MPVLRKPFAGAENYSFSGTEFITPVPPRRVEYLGVSRLLPKMLRRLPPLCVVALALPWLAGCVRVPVWEQRLVAKPGMVFSDSAVLASQPALLGQIEPGRSAAGGASSVGCSSCR